MWCALNVLMVCLVGTNGFLTNNRNRFPTSIFAIKQYPFSNRMWSYENYIKRLNSNNITEQTNAILEDDRNGQYTVDDIADFYKNHTSIRSFDDYKKELEVRYPELFNHTFKGQPLVQSEEIKQELERQIREGFEDDEDIDIPEAFYKTMDRQKKPKIIIRRADEEYFEKFHKPLEDGKDSSENFEIIKNVTTRFSDIGGYDSVKSELRQCVDILSNYETYAEYNVRIPKGLILEGPPGNGKTLLAKGFAGESQCNFITVAGSEFQEKYVGVGSARVKELFKLAKENTPCIIFIDEIDAIGRKRSSDPDSASSERDNTLNQLLVAMDGFKSSDGIFIVGATNRADLLDPALLRPGRIDKRIFISLPDSKTRQAILDIHIEGKPYDETIIVGDLTELTTGMSAAQIENLLNEAMLYAIRDNRKKFTQSDIDTVMNRIMAGWQPTEHQFTQEIIDQIIVHEMGHAMVGFLAKQHSKLTKIVINLSSPNTPGYTVFEGSTSSLYTRDSLFEHLMILLAGRVAEEVFYNVSVTTGAINDFEEALKLAEKMVVYYGMGNSLIYPSNSEKYKEQIDNEMVQLIQDAYEISRFIVQNCKEVIEECTELLKTRHILRREELMTLIQEKYPEVMDLYIGNV